MEVRVLGPLDVRYHGRRLDLGPPKQRLAFAALVLNVGRCVTVDQLIHELWGGRPIASAVENARTYAARLRRLLESTVNTSARIERMGSGYRLLIDLTGFDLHRYEDDAARGRAALRAGDPHTARTLLERARLRWRGRMLDGLPRGPLLDLRCSAVERDLASLVEDLAEVHLTTGKPDGAVALMKEQLPTGPPVRERGYELLMRATYQLDGAAAALEVYQRAHRVLVDELGVEPGPALRDLHRRVLDRDPALAAPRASVTVTPPVPVPRQLPAAPTHFVARDAEVALVRDILLAAGRRRRSPAVAVIYGPGGAGKSALALRVANQLTGHFPDGQLYVDLLGSTPGIAPPSPTEVLERLLHALGMGGDRAPRSLPEAAALFRTATAGRRLLLVTDNATGPEQVTPLLPSAATCAVLVTSRRPLTAVDVDHRMRLALLPRSASRTMFEELAPGRAIDAAIRDAILDRCGDLPLAIRIVAARLANRPDLPAHELARRLADHPLDELQHDGLAVRASIRAGYDALATDAGPLSLAAARAFRALGALPLPHVTPDIVAALVGAPGPGAVLPALDYLVDAQLLEPAPDGRYRLHGLVREAAIEIAARGPVDERKRSLRRAVTHYAHTADRAAAWMQAGTASAFALSSRPPATVMSFDTSPDAREWVTTSCENLMLTLQHTGTGVAGGTRGAWLALSERLWAFLYRQHRWSAAQRLGRLVLAAAERLADDEMAGWGRLLCGRNDAHANRLEEARRHLTGARHAMRAAGNERGEVLALVALGNVAGLGGDSEAAIRCYEQATGLVEATGRHRSSDEFRAVVLVNLSVLHIMRGQYDRAAAAAEECIAISRRRGYRRRLGHALNNVAAVHICAGRYADAILTACEAFGHADASGDRVIAGAAILMRSHALLWLARYTESLADVRSALARARHDGDRYVEAAALRHEVEILSATGRHEDARRVREQAETAQATQLARDPVIEHLLHRYRHRSAEPTADSV